MARLFFFGAILVLISAKTTTAADDNPKAVGEFVGNYHRSPRPDLVPTFLDQVLQTDGLDFNSRPEEMLLAAQCFGYMARGNRKLIDAFESRFDKASHTGKTFLLEALKICGDQGTIKTLQSWTRDPKFAPHKKQIAAAHSYLIDPNRVSPRDKPAEDAQGVLMLLADLLVTGDYAPVSRILDALDRPLKLRELLTNRLKAPFPDKEKKAAIVESLRFWKLVKPNSADALVDGDLEQLALYDRKGRVKEDAVIILAELFDFTDDEVERFQAHVMASFWLRSYVKEHAKLAELLKSNYRTRPAKSQDLIKKWLGIDQPKFVLDKESQRLQGIWQATSQTTDGDTVDGKLKEEMLKYMRWTFDEDEIEATSPLTMRTDDGKLAEVLGQGQTTVHTFKIDASKSPKVIRMAPLSSVQSDTTEGIYKLDGNGLSFCFRNDGKGLPKSFSAAPGSGNTLLILTKMDEAKKK